VGIPGANNAGTLTKSPPDRNWSPGRTRCKVIVIDPFLTNNPKTPQQYTNLDSLGKVDVILVTHGHGDSTGDVVGAGEAHGRDRARPCRAHRDDDRSRLGGAG